jgi:hypothetical protein
MLSLEEMSGCAASLVRWIPDLRSTPLRSVPLRPGKR